MAIVLNKDYLLLSIVSVLCLSWLIIAGLQLKGTGVLVFFVKEKNLKKADISI